MTARENKSVACFRCKADAQCLPVYGIPVDLPPGWAYLQLATQPHFGCTLCPACIALVMIMLSSASPAVYVAVPLPA